MYNLNDVKKKMSIERTIKFDEEFNDIETSCKVTKHWHEMSNAYESDVPSNVGSNATLLRAKEIQGNVGCRIIESKVSDFFKQYF